MVVFTPTVGHSKWGCIGVWKMRADEGEGEVGGVTWDVVCRVDLTQLTAGSGSRSSTVA